MSAPGNEPSTAEPKPKAITKFKRRISRILGKDDAKRAAQAPPAQSSTAGPKPTEATSTTTTPATITETPGQSKAAGKATETPGPTEAAPTKSAAIPVRPKPGLSAEEYARAQEEKVRALFAKYNVTLEVGEWTPPFKPDLPRVEKKIRMRVHRTCHRCQTQFGADKVCKNCKHPCCKKCARYPLKKGGQETRSKDAGAAAKSDTQSGKRPATQRSRMICHECKTPFKSKSKQCANCQHERCSQCQRSPLKGETSAGGGIGAALSRSFIKWTCHECDNVHRDPENPCLKCGHDKCDLCKKEKVSRGTSKPTGSSEVQVTEDRSKTADLSAQATAA